MPWEERSKAMMRAECVEAVLSKRLTKSQACRDFGISRPTGDKWIKRFLRGESMEDRSRAPFKVTNRISPEMEQTIIGYRNEFSAPL